MTMENEFHGYENHLVAEAQHTLGLVILKTSFIVISSHKHVM